MMGKEVAYIENDFGFFFYGIGIPFALKQAGFGMGIFLLIFTAVVNGKIFDYNPRRFFFLHFKELGHFPFVDFDNGI